MFRSDLIPGYDKAVDYLASCVTSIPDYPKPGILFRDITSLCQDARAFGLAVDLLTQVFACVHVDKIVSAESRGYLFGAPLAARLNCGFVMVRKPGKLPVKTVKESYAKEYGTDTIEIHDDAIGPGDVVLIHDDILATGGTASAAVRLVKGFGPKAVYCNFIIDITDCPRTSPIPEDVPTESLLHLAEK